MTNRFISFTRLHHKNELLSRIARLGQKKKNMVALLTTLGQRVQMGRLIQLLTTRKRKMAKRCFHPVSPRSRQWNWLPAIDEAIAVWLMWGLYGVSCQKSLQAEFSAFWRPNRRNCKRQCSKLLHPKLRIWRVWMFSVVILLRVHNWTARRRPLVVGNSISCFLMSNQWEKSAKGEFHFPLKIQSILF